MYTLNCNSYGILYAFIPDGLIRSSEEYMIFQKSTIFIVLIIFCALQPVMAGIIFGSDGNLGGGYRWDAESYDYQYTPNTTLERSLDGGLRYSLEGGSVEAYRDQFTWDVLPTVGEMSNLLDLAFSAWESNDPISGLGTDIFFIDDSANTLAVGDVFASANILGAEIDLFGSDAGDTGLRATSYFWATDDGNEATLTSGTTDYSGAYAIIGSDINMNNNGGAVYSLDIFQRILTHEIGHSLGLGDLEDFGGNGFIDDNFDPNDPLGTLTNSWAHLVNPLDPSSSLGLNQYFNVTTADLAVSGVDLLMESWGVGIGPNNPLSNPIPLTADEYGMRQFLYPTLVQEAPEPSTFVLFIASWGLLISKRFRI